MVWLSWCLVAAGHVVGEGEANAVHFGRDERRGVTQLERVEADVSAVSIATRKDTGGAP